jgi:hypothetical protein
MAVSRITKLKRQQDVVQEALEMAIDAQSKFTRMAIAACDALEVEAAEAANTIEPHAGLHDKELISWLRERRGGASGPSVDPDSSLQTIEGPRGAP